MTKNRKINRFIPLTRPFHNHCEIGAIAKVIKSGWITQGPCVQEFEERFAAYVGSKYAVAVSSGTTALHAALIAAGVKKDDEVIVPSFSFIATANVIRYCGAKPVFVDIDPKTYNIDPQMINTAITKRTRAIIPVHQIGLPAEVDEIKAIANKYNLLIIEDAACAVGAEYRGKKIGSPHGLMACFSFHPRKIISTGEGGMVTTNDKGLTECLKKIRHQGMSCSDVVRHKSNKILFEEYPIIGYNYRMTDLQATIGIEQLKKIDKIIAQRIRCASLYNEAFKDLDFIDVPYCPPYSKHTYQSYMIRWKHKKITRNLAMQLLLDKGISTRRGIMSIHREKPYLKFAKGFLRETEKATDQCIILPLFPAMKDAEHKFVIDSVLKIAGYKN